jgi:hypothetical protein
MLVMLRSQCLDYAALNGRRLYGGNGEHEDGQYTSRDSNRTPLEFKWRTLSLCEKSSVFCGITLCSPLKVYPKDVDYMVLRNVD